MPKRYAARPISDRGEVNLARRVEHLRREKTWSYETLANEMSKVGCPITKAALHSIEQGNPRRRITVNELIAFAEIFTDGNVPELLKPRELVEQEWAEKVAAEFIVATRGLDDAQAAMLRAAILVAEVGRTSDELSEYVSNLWKSASPTRQWFGEFVGVVDEDQLERLTDLTSDFWEQVLAVIDQQLSRREGSD